MNRLIFAIIYKEFLSIKNSIKGLIFNLIVLYTILMISVLTKSKSLLNSTNELNSYVLNNFSIYILIFLGFLATTYTLKFWQEKSNKTLEVLLSTPISARIALFSKVLASEIFSILVIIIGNLFTQIFFYFKFGKITFSITSLLIVIMISALLNISYGIINGYCMWCASTSIAKISQLATYVIMIGGITGIITGINQSGFSKNTIITLISSIVILSIGSVYCLILTNKEKIVLHQID